MPELQRAIKSVTPLGSDAREWRSDALAHVLLKVLPHLGRVKNSHWSHYVKRAVKNFYRDKYRKSVNPDTHINHKAAPGGTAGSTLEDRHIDLLRIMDQGRLLEASKLVSEIPDPALRASAKQAMKTKSPAAKPRNL